VSGTLRLIIATDDPDRGLAFLLHASCRVKLADNDTLPSSDANALFAPVTLARLYCRIQPNSADEWFPALFTLFSVCRCLELSYENDSSANPSDVGSAALT
jgi:hypothetical protein